uniref:Uncharacterized protein n=1 Tax=Arundo donax TaxID=35708 RepID=A0A0A9FFC3_ARUDO
MEPNHGQKTAKSFLINIHTSMMLDHNRNYSQGSNLHLGSSLISSGR